MGISSFFGCLDGTLIAKGHSCSGKIVPLRLKQRAVA
jgi:hypothetical protein